MPSPRDSRNVSERHQLEEYEEEEMEGLASDQPEELSTLLSGELRALVCSGDGSHVIFLLVIVVAAVRHCRPVQRHRVLPAATCPRVPRQVVVIGRMVVRDLKRDWTPCDDQDSLAKHFYCVNITQVHNVLAVSKKPFRPKD